MITQLHVRDCLKTGVFPFSKGPGFETKAMVLKLILTCATWRVTVRDDTDHPPQGTETAF